jgi:hypothetical protein
MYNAKNYPTYLFIIFVILTILVMSGCQKNYEKEWQWPKNSFGGPPQCSPEKYFPIKLGTTWTYKITLYDKPIQHHIISWQTINDVPTYSNRTFFKKAYLFPKQKEFLLKIELVKLINQKKQSGLIGAKFAVLEDELGIFDDAERVFYAIEKKKRFKAYKCTTFALDSPQAPVNLYPELLKEKFGLALDVLFIATAPSASFKYDQYSDAIYFDESIPNKDSEYPTLKFTKISNAESTGNKQISKEKAPLYKEIIETSFFKKDLGMTKFIQTIGNKKTMEWNLVDFKP